MHNAHYKVKSKCTSEPCILHSMKFDDRPEPAQRLEQARKARGFKTPKAAASFFGWSYETYIQHEQGTRGISRAAGKYAKAFRVSEGWLLTGEGQIGDVPRMVPIVGKAGAGPDGAVLFATGQGNFGEVEAPADAAQNAEALEVEGNSMYGIANDGWILFYEDREAPSGEHMGELCVCWLEDDRVLVKFPQPGSQTGLFHLESANAPMMRDVPVRAFAIVTDIKTRKAAQRFIRRNPNHEVADLKIA